MSRIVVAAFEPFGGRSINRAQRAARLLEGRSIAGRAVEIRTLKTVYASLPGELSALFAEAPELLLLVGESGPTRHLLVERLAVNVAHARLGDNAGARPIDEELVRGGELARRVTFDPRTVANAALRAGVPCDVSSHAGTFCCNAALYHALGLQADKPSTAVAFVHVPARWPWARDRRAADGLAAIAAALVGSAAT